jgi:hypothetical protein
LTASLALAKFVVDLACDQVDEPRLPSTRATAAV